MSESTDTTTTTEPNSTIHHTDLTAFQQNLLVAIAGLEGDAGETYGLAIKRRTEALYGHEINHGRLYPNLDELVEKGLVRKGEIDDRTNSYAITELGETVLDERREEIVDAFGGELP